MYSRERYGKGDVTLPPRYSGTRFSANKRADGRDEDLTLPRIPPAVTVRTEEAAKEETSKEETNVQKIFNGIGSHDLLIAALVILLSGEENCKEIILMLIFLLCSR